MVRKHHRTSGREGPRTCRGSGAGPRSPGTGRGQAWALPLQPSSLAHCLQIYSPFEYRTNLQPPPVRPFLLSPPKINILASKVILRMVSPNPSTLKAGQAFSHLSAKPFVSRPALASLPTWREWSECAHTLYKCTLHTHCTHAYTDAATNHSRHTQEHVVPGITLVSIFPWVPVYL